MHETRIRVRFDEVDTMHIVHNARYLVYFEVARTEYFRALGVAYRDVMASGTHLAVVESGVRYLRPARYDDELRVETRCTAVGGATVTLSFAVRRDDDVLATGFVRLGAVDPSQRVKRMPPGLRARFEAAVESDPYGGGASRVQGNA
jgi:acyl-CoA thioester hydrolase